MYHDEDDVGFAAAKVLRQHVWAEVYFFNYTTNPGECLLAHLLGRIQAS
jgi:hypothetical protein